MKQTAIKRLATVTELDLSGNSDWKEIVVDFGGGDINRLVQAACDLIPGEDSKRLKQLAEQVLMTQPENSVMGSLVLPKKAIKDHDKYNIP